MKYLDFLMVSVVALLVTIFVGEVEARSPMAPPSAAETAAVIPEGLSCNATLRLPSGNDEIVPVLFTDHMMFGPIASANLEAGDQSAKIPLEYAGFVGMIIEEKSSGLLLIKIEAKISRTVFEPALNEVDTISESVMVLSRKIKAISKGEFSVDNFGGGAVFVECELN